MRKLKFSKCPNIIDQILMEQHLYIMDEISMMDDPLPNMKELNPSLASINCFIGNQVRF